MKGNERLLVTGNTEVPELEIAGGLVIAVPVGGKVVGSNRRAIVIEVELSRVEKLAVDVVLCDGVKRRQGVIPQLVEASTETADRLPAHTRHDNPVVL